MAIKSFASPHNNRIDYLFIYKLKCEQYQTPNMECSEYGLKKVPAKNKEIFPIQ